jgi:hypothetical protein
LAADETGLSESGTGYRDSGVLIDAMPSFAAGACYGQRAELDDRHGIHVHRSLR